MSSPRVVFHKGMLGIACFSGFIVLSGLSVLTVHVVPKSIRDAVYVPVGGECVSNEC